MDFTTRYTEYKQAVEQCIANLGQTQEPHTLYQPIRYIMKSGGKRIRPVLTLLACGAAGGQPMQALHAAVAVEMLHNFTLVHDDIMDAADVRRNQPTVHTKWNANTAILAGDTMLALAHRILLLTPDLPNIKQIVDAFSTGIIEVCEGQAYDLAFQDRAGVSLHEYLTMIDKKTARMLELAVRVGALIGNGREEHITALAHYALAVGTAFQIQDDLLDISPENMNFGKVRGGDIMVGKKTYLVVRALETVHNGADRALLERFVREKGAPAEDVERMYELFERNGILEQARTSVAEYSSRAETALDTLPPSESLAMLRHLTDMLLKRKN